MNAKTLKRLPAFALVAIALSGCETMVDRVGFVVRSGLHASAYAALDPAAKDRLRHGTIATGDTPEMVVLALGVPDARAQSDGSMQWTYLTFRGDGNMGPLGQAGPNRSSSRNADMAPVGGHYEVGRRITFQTDSDNRLRVVGL